MQYPPGPPRTTGQAPAKAAADKAKQAKRRGQIKAVMQQTQQGY